jgi:hypothetical protein
MIPLTHYLLRDGVQPKKHFLDNKISSNMKEHIRTKYNFTVKLVPPGCHRCNATKVAIVVMPPRLSSTISKATSSASLPAPPNHSRSVFEIASYPKLGSP